MPPLHVAVWEGNTAAVASLLAAKASVGLKSKAGGFTAVHCACLSSRCVRVCVREGRGNNKRARSRVCLCVVWRVCADWVCLPALLLLTASPVPLPSLPCAPLLLYRLSLHCRFNGFHSPVLPALLRPAQGHSGPVGAAAGQRRRGGDRRAVPGVCGRGGGGRGREGCRVRAVVRERTVLLPGPGV